MRIKRITVLFLFIIIGTQCVIADNKADSDNLELDPAVQLVWDFFKKLKDNTPFTLDDEIKYFGGLQGVGVFLYLHSGYLKEGTDWPEWKEKPKYSLIGELIRQNRSIFLIDKNLTATNIIFYFSPASYCVKFTDYNQFGVSRNEKLVKIAPSSQETIIVSQYKRPTDTEPQGKRITIIFILDRYVADRKFRIDLSQCLIDNEALMYKLGYIEARSGGVIFPKDKLEKLVEHINHLEKNVE